MLTKPPTVTYVEIGSVDYWEDLGKWVGLSSTQLVSSAPEVDSEQQRDDGQDGAEFVDVPCGFAGVAGHRSKDGLDVEIVASMQDRAGPQAAGFEAHPGETERDGDNQDAETT